MLKRHNLVASRLHLIVHTVGINFNYIFPGTRATFQKQFRTPLRHLSSTPGNPFSINTSVSRDPLYYASATSRDLEYCKENANIVPKFG